MRKKLIVFDVDGVLLSNKLGGFKDILVILGKGKEVKKIDKEYQKRKHAGPWGMEKLAKLYKGFSEKKLREITVQYRQKNLTRDAKECIMELKKRGCVVGALSSNPQFIMDALVENLLLDFSEGTQLEFKKRIATGRIQKKVDRYGKSKILKRKIKSYGLKEKDIIVVGDSITDLPMANLAGAFIAFRPKEGIIKEKANKVVKNFQRLQKELLRLC